MDATRPDLVVLDVNETLSDLSLMGEAFERAGLGAHEVEAWFAGVLRDAFALTLLGDLPGFADLASSSLRARLTAAGADPDAAADVMERFTGLPLHPDVEDGIVGLAEAGCRVVTLSNGSASVARTLLEGTAAADVVEAYLSVEDAGAWKPAGQAYRHALDRTGVSADRAMLVAVHAWDVAGARRAGLATAWVGRAGAAYPDALPPADLEVTSLVDLAERLAA
ncbi:haloacid dehalogenase type II [Nocardioides marmoraquaticus]